jgi:hypothetical protein
MAKRRRNKVVWERADGSSDGITEDRSITLPDWSKACLRWEKDLQRVAKSIKDLFEFEEDDELGLSAEELVEKYNKEKNQ